MRIPSQFNEDNLYSRHPRRNDSTHAGRRLLRLTLGLVLVLMVMRQAAKPGVYQPFFPDSSPPVEMDAQADPVSVAEPVAILIDDDDRRIAASLVQQLPVDQHPRWLVKMSRWPASSEPLPPESIAAMSDALHVIDSLDPTQLQQWQSLLDAIGSPEQPPPELAIAWQSESAALTAALDQAAANRVVDGSVWRGGDFDLFYRYLDQAPQLSSHGVASVGVIPLLQQPEVFRGQLVRMSGTVARAEQITAPENAFDIAAYWQLWLRPADGAERPLVAIVPAVPLSIQQQWQQQPGTPITFSDGPPVTLVGRYLKRLAYQSSIGADLAPVVVGRLLIVSSPTSEPAATFDDPSSLATQPTSLLSVLLIAVAIGITLAALAYWQSTTLAKRSRALRRAGRGNPQSFLDQLQSAEPPGNSRGSGDTPAMPDSSTQPHTRPEDPS